MKDHSLLYFAFFVGSLVLGYSVSTRFYPADQDLLPGTMRLVAERSQKPINTLDNGQRSILLISATALNTPDPQLESIWLATYFASDTTIRLLPVFPSGKQSRSDFEQQLDSTFNLETGNGASALADRFLEVLKNDNYWWSGYIVFDEAALSRLLELIGGSEVNGSTLTGELPFNDFSSLVNRPRDAYTSQATVLQSVCHKFQELPAHPDMSQFFTLLSNHIYTDLDSSQLQTEMQSLFSNDKKPTCRFPTLEISQVVH